MGEKCTKKKSAHSQNAYGMKNVTNRSKEKHVCGV